MYAVLKPNHNEVNMVTEEKAKGFVNYGVQNYISLKLMRSLVPSCYLFLALISLTAGIAGNILPTAIFVLSLILIYSVVVYTFHRWCPCPTFKACFIASAFCMVSLGLIVQMAVYTVLLASKYISVLEILISAAVQTAAVIAYIIITLHKIKVGKYIGEKSAKSGQTNLVIIGSADCGYIFVKVFLGNITQTIAITAITVITVVLSVIFFTAASFHIIKVHYCRKYIITSDENGEETSPLLTVESVRH